MVARRAPAATGRRPAGRSLARAADRYALYQRSVQAPGEDIAFFSRLFRARRGRAPLALREDFCGTAYLSAEWVRGRRGRTALGVDLDPEPLRWGREHNLAPLGARAAAVTLVEADVRSVTRPRVDLTCAMNFSFCALRTRRALGDYLRAAHAGLVADGLFVAELYGGTEAIVPYVERRRVGGFTYVWEQELFNPIDHGTVCHIHFTFRDGSRLDRAFSYDWRLWTIPELRELLAEAGFRSSEVWWERVDDDGKATGRFARTEEEENQEGFIVYVVGLR